MRKVTAAIYLTLDGVMEHPAWTSPYFNAELARVQHELMASHGALLLGRLTYEAFAAAWPNMRGEEGADRMNSMPKFVASRTLTTTTWNAELLADDRGDVAHRVALVGHRVPRRPGRSGLQRQAEQRRGVAGVHRWPALGAVADEAGDAAVAQTGLGRGRAGPG